MTKVTGRIRPASTLDADIGFRIRQARQKKGWTQKDLAAYLGISFQQLYKYEQGINRIPASRLLDTARILGITPNDILY